MATLFVVDASVVMGWCFESQADEYTTSVLERLSSAEALVPPVWSFEVANVLLVAERKRRITAEDSATFLGLLAALPIRQVPAVADRSEGVLRVARRHTLSAYDASYLDLAIRENIPLATRDVALRAASKAAKLPAL